jgi:hypothetical protein
MVASFCMIGLLLGLNLDDAWADFLSLRQAQCQNAVVKGGFDFVGFDRHVQRHRADKAPVKAFSNERVHVFWLFDDLALDGQHIAFVGDLDIFGLEAGQRRLDNDLIVGAVGIDRETGGARAAILL